MLLHLRISHTKVSLRLATPRIPRILHRKISSRKYHLTHSRNVRKYLDEKECKALETVLKFL